MPPVEDTPQQLALHLERVVAAPRAVVFQMHAEARYLARWWGPQGFVIPSVELDLVVGGRYRIEMQPPDGDRFFLSGEFVRVEPPALLVYTFRWEEPDPDDRDTIVEFSLRDRGETTEVAVDQGAFATRARLALHEQGWTETLDRLDALIASEGW